MIAARTDIGGHQHPAARQPVGRQAGDRQAEDHPAGEGHADQRQRTRPVVELVGLKGERDEVDAVAERGHGQSRPEQGESPAHAGGGASARGYGATAMLIAIDGPAGAGKSTVARAVAQALGWTYLDSGAMYRCVALAGGRDRDSLEIAFELGDRVLLDGRDVSDGDPHARDRPRSASQVAADPAVRAAMVARSARTDRRRRLGRRGPRHRHRRRARRRAEGLADRFA